jgi:hypothetical protein
MRVKKGGTSRAESSTLTAGVGLPGKKDGLVGGRKVSETVARGVSNAMGNKENRAGIWNNK